MRSLPLAFMAALSLFAAPAFAGVYTETAAFSGSPSGGGTQTINAAQFDPTLGTLTGVTLTATGSYMPSIFVGSPVPTASVLNVELIADGSTSLNQAADGNYTLVQKNAYLVGPAEQFSETIGFTDSSILKNVYTGLYPNEIVGLANVDVFSLSATKGAWGSMADDVSLFSGDLSITYTYTPLPEPASLAMLGLGAALLASRRRSSRS